MMLIILTKKKTTNGLFKGELLVAANLHGILLWRGWVKRELLFAADVHFALLAVLHKNRCPGALYTSGVWRP
jgi:hypothetical protein